MRVASLFPNESSLLRLVSAILMEISEEWETGRKYLDIGRKFVVTFIEGERYGKFGIGKALAAAFFPTSSRPIW
jgi:hypothetical protein